MSRQDEIERLKQAIAAQQALRGILPDEQIEATLRSLRAQLARYQAEVQGGGAVAQGEESMAVGQQGVGVGGNVEQAIINTGVIYMVYRNAPGKPRLDEKAFKRILGDYLAWVQKAYGKARLYGLESMRTVGEKPKRRLEDVFVPLALQRFYPPRRAEIEEMAQAFGQDQHAHQKAYLRLVEQQRREGEAIDLKDLLTLRERLAIIGGAGSGKSTLLAYLAASLAGHIKDGADLPFSLPENGKALVPVIVPLRYRGEYLRLIEENSHEVLTRAHPGTLAGFILWYLMKRSQAIRVADEALAEDFFDRLLRGGGCLVMLDGLDEVVSGEARGQVREEVERLADEIYPGNRFIVTARESGYRENAIFSDDFLRLDVLPLEDEKIHVLVENWCRQLYPEQVETQTREITEAIAAINARYERQNMPSLIRTPLMVTMVVSVKWGEAELPRERARLYEAVVKVILQAQYLDDDPTRRELVNWGGPWEEQRDWLSYLALEMQRGGQASAAIDERRLREILRDRLPPESLDQFIVAVRSRGGVLEEKADLFQFAHLTFQEFLAARLLAKERDAALKALAPRVADPWWREALLLLYGFAKMDYPPFAQRYLDWLSALPPDLRLAVRELAGAAVLEIERPDPALRRKQAERLAAALSDPTLPADPQTRARAGDTLAALGDPRFAWFPPLPLGEGLGPGPSGTEAVRALLPARRWAPQEGCWVPETTWGFVQVPSGPFLMGSNPQRDPQAYADEQPQHEVNLPYDYWIARYPVTVAQWRAFVEATGYDAFDKDALRDPDNHPVRWITWYNALAYARWLDGVLKAVAGRMLQDAAGAALPFWEAVASGKYQVTLPSEAEWEKAARGGLQLPDTSRPNTLIPNPLPARIYPWGDAFEPDRANTNETGLGTTSAVGAFPRGASPYGVLDLSGNVWEWTRSLWGEDWGKLDYGYPYDPTDGRENLDAPRDVPRVLRGGLFLSFPRGARAAVRSRNYPGGRYRRSGFRVVVVPMSVASEG